MYPPSSFLTLPLEVRQHIYSYLLDNKYPKLHLASDLKHSAYCLSRTCHQLYQEVPKYYYDTSVFQLSLFEYGFIQSVLPKLPRKWAENVIKINLKRVQHLRLEMELHEYRFSDFQQVEQLEWLCGALVRARQGSVETCWLKSLDMLVCAGPRGEIGNYKRQVTEEEMARCKAFLQPLIGRVGKLTFRGRQVTLDDEDFGVDNGDLARIDDSNGISGRQGG